MEPITVKQLKDMLKNIDENSLVGFTAGAVEDGLSYWGVRGVNIATINDNHIFDKNAKQEIVILTSY